MASAFINYFCNHHLFLTVIAFTVLLLKSSITVNCNELVVGGDYGWAIPPANYQYFYNDWASRNRFQTNDTLRFEYKKDSVMAVKEEEYEQCWSSHPVFFDNTGHTVFALDRPGFYYFVSGVAGHCKKGLKMTVKSLDPQLSPPATTAGRSSPTSTAAELATGFVGVIAVGIIFEILIWAF